MFIITIFTGQPRSGSDPVPGHHQRHDFEDAHNTLSTIYKEVYINRKRATTTFVGRSTLSAPPLGTKAQGGAKGEKLVCLLVSHEEEVLGSGGEASAVSLLAHIERDEPSVSQCGRFRVPTVATIDQVPLPRQLDTVSSSRQREGGLNSDGRLDGHSLLSLSLSSLIAI
ncbi:unnamed protein product [Boreogadus saida]